MEIFISTKENKTTPHPDIIKETYMLHVNLNWHIAQGRNISKTVFPSRGYPA